jgi:hypothetical protein
MEETEADGSPLVPELEPLSSLEIEPASATRTRARCHALLARHRRRRSAGAERVAGFIGVAWRFLEPALVSALVIFYLGGAVEKVLLVYSR